MASKAAKSILVSVLLATTISARTVKQFAAPGIPSIISTDGSDIILGSDTLALAGRILQRGVDYRWDKGAARFVLNDSTFLPTDTLTVIYSKVPVWMNQTAGRDLPEPASFGNTLPVPSTGMAQAAGTPFVQNIKLSGAKSFRFSARNAGTTEFGQSLDLRIAGELSPGVELSGALSDRGYDPIYGTANSRLNELDKVNLQLKSRAVLVRMGDITLPNEIVPRSKSISGAMFQLQYPNWRVNGAAARPKGRYSSAQFEGDNSYQGPYQVNSGTGVQPIVPGSEIVWLDGKQLERGSEKDYTVDYPSGLITFSPKNPIDRRSRIEIDFEPAASSYRQELLAAGGGVNRSDSSIYLSVEAIREGDNKNQPLVAELSDSDKQQLQNAGDSDPSRSGVVHDTLGSYVLVTDSPPDTVYQYAGEKNGQYSVTFTYVGTGRGSYRFLGTGNYQFVGATHGDYLPIVVLPRAERTDYFRSLLGFRSRAIGELTADIRQTSYNRNLWSTSSSATHSGTFYNLQLTKRWQGSGRPNSLTVRRRFLQPEFRYQDRLDKADFGRDFLLPNLFTATTNEALNEISASLRPVAWGEISPSYADLDYRNSFDARLGGTTIRLMPWSRLDLRGSWKEVSSRLPNDSGIRTGKGDNLISGATYSLTKKYVAQAQVEYDRRRNDYSGVMGGTRYLRWSGGLNSPTESIQYENYHEDSLTYAWQESSLRRRLTAHSARRMAAITYDASATWQWLKDQLATQQSFLGRTSISYNDPSSQTQITSSYTLSNELRNARGISYLQVDRGRGNYSLINGQYVPDPDGNYLQIEEILSDRQRVRRGEKSFLWSKNGNQYSVRFDANIDEELLEAGRRTAVWLIPFYSDSKQPYLYLTRRYDSDIRLFPIAGVYAVNLSLSDALERRNIAGTDRTKRDSRESVGLKQARGIYYLEEVLDLFQSRRDDYYSGSGDISGYKISANLRRTRDQYELSAGVAYRKGTSEQGERALTYALLPGARFRVLGRGEVRLNGELYRQRLTDVADNYSYQLTDSRYGLRGALWTAAYNYSVRANMKINISLSGRHSDDRAGRVTGRAEVVAGF